MTIHPSITFEQHLSVLKAIRANQRIPVPTQTIGVLIGGVIGLVFALIIITPATRIAGVGLGLMFVGLFLTNRHFFKKRVAAMQHTSFLHMQPVLNGNEMSIDSSGICGTWVAGKATYDFSWRAFDTVLDGPDDLLFLYAPCCYIRIPKDELDPQQVLEVLSWYSESKGHAKG